MSAQRIVKEYTASGILERIKEFGQDHAVKVVSFDIFDTLLFRTVEKPTDIFVKTGEKAVEAGVLPPYLDGEDYRTLRIKAEKKAREIEKKKNGTTEITYQQIFEAMPEYIGQRDQLQNLEYQIECESCYVNPVMMNVLEILRGRGYRIVGISDMYFSEKEIDGLLRQGGFRGETFPIYVSSEYKAAKSAGDLYDVVLGRLGLSRTELVHIGDNYNSDYLMASEKEISAIHYCIHDAELYKGLQYERLIYENNMPQLHAMRRYVPSMNEESADDLWYQTGVQIYGPLLSAFVEWVVDMAVKEGIRQIFPLMREGRLLSKLLFAEIEGRGLDIRVEPLYVSRKAVFIPALSEVRPDKLEGIFKASQSTVRSVMQIFGLKDFEGRFTEQYGDDPEKSYYRLADEFCEFLAQDGVQERFQAYRKQKVEESFGYFRQMGLEERFITVDIGFHATIQTGMEAILREKGVQNHNIHLMAFSTRGTIDNVFQNVDVRGYAGSFGANEEINTYVTWHHRLLEQAIMCDEGSTQGYCREQNGSYSPVLGKQDIIPEEQKKRTAKIQQGIMEFQNEYLRVRKLKQPGCFRPVPAETARAYERLVKVPSRMEAMAFGAMVHDENYGVESGSVLCGQEKIDYIREHGFTEFAKAYDISSELWLEGLRTCSERDFEFESLCNNAGTNLARSMAHLAGEIRGFIDSRTDRKNGSVVIIGAGEAGQTLYHFLRVLNISVEGFIDNNRKLQGEKINGIGVEAMEYPYQSTCYALGTLAFADRLLGQAVHTLRGGASVFAYRDGVVKHVVITVDR